MTVVGDWFTNAIFNALKKKYDITTDTVKVMICTNAYVLNKNTHDFRDDITNEVVATGYTAGGVTLTNVTLTVNSSNEIVLDGDDVEWNISGTMVARYAIIYVSLGSAATDVLVGYVDFGADVTAIDGKFKITWNSAGILKGSN